MLSNVLSQRKCPFSHKESEKNSNGVPYGEPDPEIKCAFFRVINPRAKTYKNFLKDVDKGRLDSDLIGESGWPLLYLQQGADKSLLEGAGLDTSDLDGYVVAIMSHKDLMWPHRA
jgi:hypothetical protein